MKQRNFDPETRTLRKHNPSISIEDTVEKAVEGLAEKIIAEDAERRQQELVSHLHHIIDLRKQGLTRTL